MGTTKGKLAAKTAICTLLGLVFVIVIAAGLTSLISPLTMGNLTYRMGWKSFSVYLTKAGYERSGDINDLGELVERSISAKNHKIVEEYGKKLMEHEDYAEFVRFQNNHSVEGRPLDYDGYVRGSYVYSKYQLGKAQDAFAEARDFLRHGGEGYAWNNPMTRFVEAYCARPDENFSVASVTVLLEQLYDSLAAAEQPDGASLKNICMDMYLIYDVEGNAAKKAEWQEKYGIWRGGQTAALFFCFLSKTVD